MVARFLVRVRVRVGVEVWPATSLTIELTTETTGVTMGPATDCKIPLAEEASSGADEAAATDEGLEWPRVLRTLATFDETAETNDSTTF